MTIFRTAFPGQPQGPREPERPAKEYHKAAAHLRIAQREMNRARKALGYIGNGRHDGQCDFRVDQAILEADHNLTHAQGLIQSGIRQWSDITMFKAAVKKGAPT